MKVTTARPAVTGLTIPCWADPRMNVDRAPVGVSRYPALPPSSTKLIHNDRDRPEQVRPRPLAYKAESEQEAAHKRVLTWNTQNTGAK